MRRHGSDPAITRAGVTVQRRNNRRARGRTPSALPRHATRESHPATERVPDSELGVAVVLVGLVVLLTTVLVPLLG